MSEQRMKIVVWNRQVLRQLIDQIVIVLMSLEIDTSNILHDTSEIIETVAREPEMIKRE